MAKYKEVHELEVDDVGEFDLETEVGRVTFVGAETERLAVEVEREFGDTSEAEAVAGFQVDVTRHEGRVRIVGRRTCEDERFQQMRVHFRLKLPRQYQVRIKTAGGSVHGEAIQGDLSINTPGGSIRLDRCTEGACQHIRGNHHARWRKG